MIGLNNREKILVSREETEVQIDYIKKIKQCLEPLPRKPIACVLTFGCAQNENDSEKLKGMLLQMGYQLGEEPEQADLILYNTCAVRAGAEDRVFGNLGALKHLKRKKEHLILGICGCMIQQKQVVERLKAKYRHVDLIFGTHTFHRFPQILWEALEKKQRVIAVEDADGYLAEGLPQYREDPYKAGVSIMYGCNNFCSYCIVPYTRGRERSRDKEDIIKECRTLAEQGYREITLLGQNVNSYGNDLPEKIDFADLLAEINCIDGIRRIKFMTSHPKDISDKLIATMAECENVCKYLHLPFQAGNNRVLKAMNRKYTCEHYLAIIEKVKKAMPDITLTSDVIVGFPGETTEEFEDTLSLVQQVEFDSLYTFIFSPREGTPAARMEDVLTPEEKSVNFRRLVDLQNEISKKKNEAYVGKTVEILVDGVSKNNEQMMAGRTEGNKIVNFKAKTAQPGKLISVRITEAQTWALIGEEV